VQAGGGGRRPVGAPLPPRGSSYLLPQAMAHAEAERALELNRRAGASAIYENTRRDATLGGRQSPWRVAPSPFAMTAELAARVEALGPALLDFLKVRVVCVHASPCKRSERPAACVCDGRCVHGVGTGSARLAARVRRLPRFVLRAQANCKLYRDSVAGIQPPWVATLLDHGKPQALVDFQRSPRYCMVVLLLFRACVCLCLCPWWMGCVGPCVPVVMSWICQGVQVACCWIGCSPPPQSRGQYMLV
jgi:hypothetical protein